MTKKKSAAKVVHVRAGEVFNAKTGRVTKKNPTAAMYNDIGKLQHEQEVMREELRVIRKHLNELLQTMECVVSSYRYEPTTDYPGKAGSGMTDVYEDPRKDGACPDTNKTGEPMKTFESGAVRGTGCMNARYDLINPVALRRLAETYAEGSKRYGDSNWQKGIPSPDLLNHAITHIEAWRNGDTSEDHLAHAVWNLCTLMYTEERLPAKLIVRHYAPGFDPNTDPTNVKL